MSTPVINEVSTWLHYCQRGSITGVKEYLTNYRDVLNSTDKVAWNGLHYAAHGQHTEVVELLVQAGIKLDELNGAGETALIIAAARGYTDIVLILARAGADTKIKNKDGMTAYDVAPNDGIRRALGGYDPRVEAKAGTTFQQAVTDSDSD